MRILTNKSQKEIMKLIVSLQVRINESNLEMEATEELADIGRLVLSEKQMIEAGKKAFFG